MTLSLKTILFSSFSMVVQPRLVASAVLLQSSIMGSTTEKQRRLCHNKKRRQMGRTERKQQIHFRSKGR